MEGEDVPGALERWVEAKAAEEAKAKKAQPKKRKTLVRTQEEVARHSDQCHDYTAIFY